MRNLNSIIVVILVAACLAIVPLWQNDWLPLSADGVGLICGAEQLAEQGSFSHDRRIDFSFHFIPCWTSVTYPFTQLALASIISVTHLSALNTMLGLQVLAYILTAVGMHLITKRLFNEERWALVAGLLTATSLAVIRSHIAAPQNLLGYLCIVFILWLIIFSTTQPSLKAKTFTSSLIIFCVLSLSLFHQLSFVVLIISLGIWLVIIMPRWWQRISIVLLASAGLMAGLIYFVQSIHLVDIQNFFASAPNGYYHPLWDHPTIWGYALTSLAIVGGIWMLRSRLPSRWLWWSMFITVLLLSHLTWIGITILPDRFVAFGWIPVTIMAIAGIRWLTTTLTQRHWVQHLLVGCILVSQFIHVWVFMQDDLVGISERYRPRTTFQEAVEWLEVYDHDHVLLGIANIAHRPIYYASLWYSGNIISYPWYRINHRDLADFQSTDEEYKVIMSDENSALAKKLNGLYTLLTTPDSKKAYQFAKKYDIRYIILKKNSQETELWDVYPTAHFTTVYENNDYVIKQLQ